MANEDLTTYTEVDPNSALTVTAASVVGASVTDDVDNYVYKDGGVDNYAAGLDHDWDFSNDGTGQAKWSGWIIANSLDDAEGLKKNSKDGYGTEITWKNPDLSLKLNNYFNGNKATLAVLSNNTTYYSTMTWTGTTITWTVYSDSARTNQVASGNITGASTSCRYVYAINAANKNKGDTWDGTVSNLNLNEGGAAFTMTAATASYSVAGQTVNLSTGYVEPATSASLAITGQTVNLSTGYVEPAASSSFAIAGQTVNLSTGYVEPATSASFVIAGQAANLLTDYVEPATSSSFAITGVNVGFITGFSMAADVASYAIAGVDVNGLIATPADASAIALTGVDVGLIAAYNEPATTAAFTISGIDVNLLQGFGMPADVASFTVTGQAVNLLSAYTEPMVSASYSVAGVDTPSRIGMPVNPASFNLTGVDTGLIAAYVIAAATQSYAVTGFDVGLLSGDILSAVSAGYTISGVDVGLTTGYRLSADSAVFNVTGQSVSLSNDVSIEKKTGVSAKQKKRKKQIVINVPAPRQIAKVQQILDDLEDDDIAFSEAFQFLSSFLLAPTSDSATPHFDVVSIARDNETVVILKNIKTKMVERQKILERDEEDVEALLLAV